MPPSVISFYLCARNESVDRFVLLATTGKNAKNIFRFRSRPADDSFQAQFQFYLS